MAREKVLIVVIDFGLKDSWPIEDVSKELEELVNTAGGEVKGCLLCRVHKPTAAYLIGSGKIEEIAGICSLQEIDTVIFSHDLKGNQQRNIEEVVKVKIIDRTQLILDIFAHHAKSQEGKMQVELAQSEYLLPRLVGKGTELSRLGGGIGTSGPGETKLEVDRRRIAERIAKLKQSLKELESNRALNRKRRQDQGIPSLSLVGYTNAGKTTLLNSLTQAGQVTADGLFTTLDSLSRQLVLPNHQKIVISDTVGFIHDLPHHLIESFKATLEEVSEADLLLEVLDVSHPNFRNLHQAVLDVLVELKANNKPLIVVLNKIDKVTDKGWIKDLESNFEHAVAISACQGENIEKLTAKITQMLSALLSEIEVNIPMNRMDLVNLAHKEGQVYSIKYYNDVVHLRARVPVQIAGKFKQLIP
ncbi:MAG: GTPase HflX [Candidatus Omnitrophota bacterium]